MGAIAGTLGQLNEYVPSEHCAFCSRAVECPARVAELRAAVQVLLGPVFDELPADLHARGQAIGTIHGRAKNLEKLIKSVLEQVRVEVAHAGGSLPIGDGQA